MALCSIPILAGRNAIQSSAPLWLLILAQAPFGLFYGWVVWRIAYRPAQRSEPAAPSPNAETS